MRSILGLVTLALLCLTAIPFDRPAAAAGTWSPTGPLTTARSGQTATLLPDGRVLAVGGDGDTGARFGALATAEVYNPSTGTWSGAGRLVNGGRTNHTATLLANGQVVVAGGGSVGLVPPRVEVYDPVSNAWSDAGRLLTARAGHIASLLPSGEILIAGGLNDRGQAIASTELFDPATGASAAVGALSTARAEAAVTVLATGQVLATGGYNPTTERVLAATDYYDPAKSTWIPTGDLNTPRVGHTATLLPDGRVLVAGGTGMDGASLASTELFDPETGTWSPGPNLAAARSGHAAVLVPEGVYVVGGRTAAPGGGPGTTLASTELYSPAAGVWAPGADLGAARFAHSVTRLQTGHVLAAGGSSSPGQSIASAELDTPSASVTPAAPVQPASGSAQQTADSITLAPGEEFTITLDSNRTTGYSWRLAQPLDESLVALVGSDYTPSGAGGLAGAGGTEVWTFHALAPGQTTIALEYVRPWETGVAPARTHATTVFIQ